MEAFGSVWGIYTLLLVHPLSGPHLKNAGLHRGSGQYPDAVLNVEHIGADDNI
jgi:hypothetical protein